MKVCHKCKVEKHESEFRVEKRASSGLFATCRACHRAYNRIYNKSDNGKRCARKYKSSPKGKLNGYIYRRTPEAKIKAALRLSKYTKTPNGRIRYQQKNRRKRESNLKFTNNDIQLVYLRFNNQCFNCCSSERLEIDHHFPLAKGHDLTLSNAVLLCRRCNASKGSKLPEEFYTQEKLKELEGILCLDMR